MAQFSEALASHAAPRQGGVPKAVDAEMLSWELAMLPSSFQYAWSLDTAKAYENTDPALALTVLEAWGLPPLSLIHI
eukprot:6711135-Alexandrium_andersonii.AAC.1